MYLQENIASEQPKKHQAADYRIKKHSAQHAFQDSIEKPLAYHMKDDGTKPPSARHAFSNRNKIEDTSLHHVLDDRINKPSAHHSFQGNTKAPTKHRLFDDSGAEPSGNHAYLKKKSSMHHVFEDNVHELSAPQMFDGSINTPSSSESAVNYRSKSQSEKRSERRKVWREQKYNSDEMYPFQGYANK
jgi:hypothetical protein